MYTRLVYWVLYLLLFAFLCHALTWVVNSRRNADSYLLEYKDHPLRQGSNRSYLSFLRGKTVVFIGDSLTRYQFLSLAYFLYRGSWNLEHILPSITNANEYAQPRWPNFYYSSTVRLGCAHVCDCDRLESNHSLTHIHEHIYHYDEELDFMMTFHFFAPSMNMSFYLPNLIKREQILRNCVDANVSLTSLQFMMSPHQVHHSYSPEDIWKFISTEVKRLKPSAIFFNQGFWRTDSFRYHANLSRLASSLFEATSLPFWKVTTEQKLGPPVDNTSFLQEIQSFGLGLYDTYEITKDLRKLIGGKVFFDKKRHFIPFVYREANLVLLELLRIAFSKDHASNFPLVGRLPVK